MEIPKIIADKKAFQLLKKTKAGRMKFYMAVEDAGLFVNVGQKSIQQYLLYPDVRLVDLMQKKQGQIAIEKLADILACHLAELKQSLCIKKEIVKRKLEETVQALNEIEKELESYGTSEKN